MDELKEIPSWKDKPDVPGVWVTRTDYGDGPRWELDIIVREETIAEIQDADCIDPWPWPRMWFGPISPPITLEEGRKNA